MKVQLRETKPTNLKELKDEIRKLWVLRMDDSEEIGQVHACQDPGGDWKRSKCYPLLEMYVKYMFTYVFFDKLKEKYFLLFTLTFSDQPAPNWVGHCTVHVLFLDD